MQFRRLGIIFGFIITLALSGAGVFVFGDVLRASAQSVNELNRQIDEQRSAVKEHDEKIKELESEVEHKHDEIDSIEEEIEIIGNSIAITNEEIGKAGDEIELTRSEIVRTEEEIRAKEEEIDKQKLLLAAFINELHRRDQQSSVMIWLQNNSFSDFFDQFQYLTTLEEQGQVTLNRVQEVKAELDFQREELEAERTRLEDLKTELERKRSDLAVQEDYQSDLLAKAENEEDALADLVEQAKADRSAAATALNSVESELSRLLASNSGSENLRLIDPNSDADLIWPVSPSYRGISTYFRDPTYPFRHLWEHNAIDVPQPQRTPVLAATDCYVAKVRFPVSTAFAYVICYGDGGFTTMYGHLNQIYVQEGQFVPQGTALGLSGGARGTLGAGTSTGPHLHFEVKLNGVYVDPLRFLP